MVKKKKKLEFWKLKVELPYDPGVPLPDIYLENMKTLIWKDTHTPMFIAALFIIAKIRKQHKDPSTEEWIKNACVNIY